jgi:hypothetical protein
LKPAAASRRRRRDRCGPGLLLLVVTEQRVPVGRRLRSRRLARLVVAEERFPTFCRRRFRCRFVVGKQGIPALRQGIGGGKQETSGPQGMWGSDIEACLVSAADALIRR